MVLGQTHDPWQYLKEPEQEPGLDTTALVAQALFNKSRRRSPRGRGLAGASGSDIEILYGPNVPGHADHLHFAAQRGIVPIGKWLERKGFDVGEHPAFGGVAPVHTDNSHHYNKDAIDVNYNGGGRWETEADALAWLKRKLLRRYG